MNRILIALISLILAACAGEGGASKTSGVGLSGQSCVHDAARSWISDANGDLLDISQVNCKGFTVRCNMQFQVTPPAANGDTTLTVVSTNGLAGCWAPGAYSCNVQVGQQDNQGKFHKLWLTCNGQTGTYSAN